MNVSSAMYRDQGGKGETPGVSTPPYSTRTPSILHLYSTSTPLEKQDQWSTTGVEWNIGGVGSD